MLRIRRIADHGVDGERLGDVVVFFFERPVFVKRVGAAGLDIVGDDAAHDEVHAGEVVGALDEFLGVVFHFVSTSDVLADGLTNGDEQRTRP